MQDELVGLEVALLAKEKGFNIDQPKGFYNHGDSKLILWVDSERYNEQKDFIAFAPTQSLLQKWLRENHEIHVHSKIEFTGTDEWEFSYKIKYLPKDKFEAKRRSPEFKEVYSYVESPSGYIGAWRTYEEALEIALTKALTLIK